MICYHSFQDAWELQIYAASYMYIVLRYQISYEFFLQA